ncbi:hypothetical protein ACFVEN_25710 [Streptomyces sp. NPDC057681]|uniref:hypothetical protein n=1 Tax=Streptomyces sp. NPDC057681 TaxID=3346209 RepID=UPI00367C672F
MRLATIVTGQKFWSSLFGPELVEARMGLISATKVPAELPDVVEAAEERRLARPLLWLELRRLPGRAEA